MRRTERNNRFRINGTLITFVDKEPATVEEAAAYRLEAVKLYGENIPEIVIERSVEYADLDIILQPRMPFERIRRITGYLVGTTDRWNNAKSHELEDRVTHDTERATTANLNLEPTD